jgi:hypothetical protein
MASEIRELPYCWSLDHLLNRVSPDPVKPDAASYASTEMISLHITFERVYGEVRGRLVGGSVITDVHAPAVPCSESTLPALQRGLLVCRAKAQDVAHGGAHPAAPGLRQRYAFTPWSTTVRGGFRSMNNP